MADDKKPDTSKSSGSKKKSSGSSGKYASYKQIQEGLESTLVGLGVGITPFDQHCGGVFVDRGPAVAEALTEAAKNNQRLKVILSRFVQTSTYAQVAGALGSLFIPIAAHHGILPPQAAGLMGASLEDLGMESGGARDAAGANGSGQDDARPSNPAGADVQPGDSYKAQGPSPS